MTNGDSIHKGSKFSCNRVLIRSVYKELLQCDIQMTENEDDLKFRAEPRGLQLTSRERL